MARCEQIDTPGLNLEDNSLCCATVQCVSSLGRYVYIEDEGGYLVDGIYSTASLFGYPFRVDGQFRFTRGSPEEYAMTLIYR